MVHFVVAGLSESKQVRLFDQLDFGKYSIIPHQKRLRAEAANDCVQQVFSKKLIEEIRAELYGPPAETPADQQGSAQGAGDGHHPAPGGGP